mmetsp:Transcript_6891/g.15279  ORF Transcript_6891/g.15279 Transcript_6891/m.15279 type:complete len:478 (+) Transcript_6891:2-1435(+)
MSGWMGRDGHQKINSKPKAAPPFKFAMKPKPFFRMEDGGEKKNDDKKESAANRRDNSSLFHSNPSLAGGPPKKACTAVNRLTTVSSNSDSMTQRLVQLQQAPLQLERSALQQLALHEPGVDENASPFTSTVSEMIQRLPSTVDSAAMLRAFCASTDLIADLGVGEGFVKPRFELSPHAVEGNKVFDNFQKALKEHNTAENRDKNAPLELVFHGTRPENIDVILKNGLDPKLRRGQAYGPGEYFSRRPSISASYCKGGLKMIVFCVIVPERCRLNDKKKARGHGDIPAAYVVVPTSSHQVPLGVMSFDGLSQSVMEKSRKMRLTLKQLSEKVKQEERLHNEANTKAKILQYLFQPNVDAAGSLFVGNKDQLSVHSQREISMFAHRSYEPEVVNFYFPGIAEPMTAGEHQGAEVLNVEKNRFGSSRRKEKISSCTCQGHKIHQDHKKQQGHKNQQDVVDGAARSLLLFWEADLVYYGIH